MSTWSSKEIFEAIKSVYPEIVRRDETNEEWFTRIANAASFIRCERAHIDSRRLINEATVIESTVICASPDRECDTIESETEKGDS